MWESMAGWLVIGAVTYSVLGVVFAIPFVIRGVGKIDPVAREGTWGFRVLIFPGSVALWPLLLRRQISQSSMPIERNPHRDCARTLEEPR